MIGMRKMEQALLVQSIVHRGDTDTAIRCLESGAKMNEYILMNAIRDFDMLRSIIKNCPHTIKIRDGMVLTVLRQNYVSNRDKIWYVLENCEVSVGAGLSAIIVDAVQYGDMDMVKYICKKWDVETLPAALIVAAKVCQYEIMRYLFTLKEFNTATLNVALCNAIYENVEISSRRKRLVKIVAFLLKNGATSSALFLKMCAQKSMTTNDSTVFKTVLSFYDLKSIVHHLEEYATDVAPEFWMQCIVEVLNMQRAATKIANSFKARRRLNLARCIYHSHRAIYSPALVFTIATHGGLL
jgi:hypothetical protein